MDAHDPSRENEFRPRKEGSFYTNDLFGFDPSSDRFCRVSTTGTGPTPRGACAVATLGKRVYVHGGLCVGLLNDFFFLDMESMTWTEIRKTGFPAGVLSHTLSRLPLNRLLLVGGLRYDGVDDGSVSKAVKIFDEETLEWEEDRQEEESPYPPEGDRFEAAFFSHRAVEIQMEGGMVVACLGGFVDTTRTKHPNHMMLFHVR